MKLQLFSFILIAFFFTSCIGDDIVFDTIDESVRIMNPIDSIQIDDSFQFEGLFLNNIGMEADANFIWESSDPSILEISSSGLATGISEGTANVSVQVNLDGKDPVLDMHEVVVSAMEVVNMEPQSTERLGQIQTTSSYLLQGSFTLSQEGSNLLLTFEDDYRASSSLPGLYVYLTNNPNTISGALEIGKVSTFSGAHSYQIGGDVALNQYNYLLYYCKPFGVKVGDGEISN